MGSKDFHAQIISFQGTRLKAMPLSQAPGRDVRDKTGRKKMLQDLVLWAGILCCPRGGR